jgi:hypothetical protein
MADIKIISPAERYKAIADAIREKNGTTGLLSPADMPQAILDIVGGGEVDGGGVTYTNIVYNEDNTITLTDKDGVIHTMECEYADGKLTSVKYDGKAVELTYDDDVLVKIGKTAVDVANAQISGIEPLDHTVTFMVDGEPYEVVSVKNGNSVNAPTEPTKEGYEFINWNDIDGNIVSFPITPTEDIVISTQLSEKPSYLIQLARAFGVDTNTYSHVMFGVNTSTDRYKIWFSQDEPRLGNMASGETSYFACTNYLRGEGTYTGSIEDVRNPQHVVDAIISGVNTTTLQSGSPNSWSITNFVWYTTATINVDLFDDVTQV